MNQAGTLPGNTFLTVGILTFIAALPLTRTSGRIIAGRNQ